jgi:hypothetical protein
VDNDPIVLSHARGLLTSSPQGATAYIDADLRDTPAILERAAGVLDFGQPVAVMLLGILQGIPDREEPGAIIARLRPGPGRARWPFTPAWRGNHNAASALRVSRRRSFTFAFGAIVSRCSRGYRDTHVVCARSPPRPGG